MADSEKLTALKKAYADIILNTAKEAAARIMVSERKAQRYQRELFAAKDESLRLLLRLKQMLDCKVNEAEMSSISQQRRIEELEAQLGEAEDIVKDLRTELRELQDELDKATSSQKQPLGESNSESQNAALPNSTEDNTVSTSVAEPAINPETNNSDPYKCYAENGACKENCFACCPDFPSIVMRRKEPELYRNGCTQRIRAFERNLLGATLSGQSDGIKNQVSNGHEDAKDKCEQFANKVDSFCDLEKTRDLVKDTEAGNEPLPKRRKMVRGAGMSNRVFIDKEVKNICKHLSELKRSRLVPRRIRSNRAAKLGRKRGNKGFPSFPLQAVDVNAQTPEDSRTSGTVLQKDAEPLVDPKSPAKESESEEVIEIEAESGKFCSSENALDSDDNLACKSDFEAANVLVSNSNSNSKDAGASEISPVGLEKNKVIKYTFQRKRKREFPTSPDSSPSMQKNISEREQNDAVELQKSGSVAGSSRHSRRVAQVARQLISLSGKK